MAGTQTYELRGSEFPFNDDNLFFLPFRHVAHQRRLVTDAPTHFPALGLVEMEMICMSCIIVGRQGGRKQAARAVPDCVKKGCGRGLGLPIVAHRNAHAVRETESGHIYSIGGGVFAPPRSAGSRGGKECVSTCRLRW